MGKKKGQTQSKQPEARSDSGRGPLALWVAIGLAALAVVVVVVVGGGQVESEGGVSSEAGASGAGAARSSSTTEAFDPEAIYAHYSGSESCASCHATQHAEWAGSHHALAERELDARDRAAFAESEPFTHGDLTSATRVRGDAFEIGLGGFSDPEAVARVARVIGEMPLRQYLVEGPDGRMQAHEAVYDPEKGDWFSVFGDENRVPGEWGHWSGRGMNWNAMCASCHNTRYHKRYDPETDTYASSMAEMSVGCEACHGGMKAHAEAYAGEAAPADDGASKPSFASKDHMMAACGACHARRFELTGDFKPGDTFDQHYLLTTVDESDIYYADGQVREEDYVYASFLSSKMHTAGVTCLDCHSPHSGETILPGNDLCMRCHSGGYPNSPVIEPSAHSFHDVQGAGGQCVNCHMPETVYMERDPRRDHGFTIPDPKLTIDEGIPNACNRCHTDKDAQWAEAAVDEWYGDKMERPTRERARVVAAARRGETYARSPLMDLLKTSPSPYWRAVAADLLEQWAYESGPRSALMSALTDTNALARAKAIHSLGPLVEQDDMGVTAALQARLDDSSRAVRFEAAWALRSDLNLSSPAGQELLHTMEINSDQPSGQARLGAFYLARQEAAKALEHYSKAVEWDPYSPGLRNELAVVYSMTGQANEALAQMKAACELAPTDAQFHYRLALAWNEVGKIHETVNVLRKTVELDPSFGRAWYNLGLALNSQGDPEGAINALIRGESAAPSDPQIPYARATILLNLNRYAEAETAARRALEIEPQYQAAQQLLNSLR